MSYTIHVDTDQTTAPAGHSAMTLNIELEPVTRPSQGWTIAYRARTANRYVRVAGLSLTWSSAYDLAHALGAARADLDIVYVNTRAAETTPGGICHGPAYAADQANVLTPRGTRVRMVEGRLPAGITVAAR